MLSVIEIEMILSSRNRENQLRKLSEIMKQPFISSPSHIPTLENLAWKKQSYLSARLRITHLMKALLTPEWPTKKQKTSLCNKGPYSQLWFYQWSWRDVRVGP